jgi:putative CRISPR-associated protein (TIGR02619 family)
MISTCGTSLLTNVARGDKELADIIRNSANATKQSATEEQRKAIERAAEKCCEVISSGLVRNVREASAELNGLLGFYDSKLNRAEGDQHILLHTDTLQGQTVAERLREYLHKNGLNVSTQGFTDLRTDSLETFQSGLAGVIKWCRDTLPGYRDAKYHVVFNLTGGFKSIQGWMQTLGMFYADEIIYIFESGGELLRIPRIPVAIDSAAVAVIRNNLTLFRRLGAGVGQCQASEINTDIPEAFFDKLDASAGLSAWGRLVWDQAAEELYSEKLLDSPDPQVVYSEEFKLAAGGNKLGKKQKRWLNERVDDLCQYLRNPAGCKKRLDYKQLRGNPSPPSTHEIDAWAQSPAWRIFLHDGGGNKILDDLREGLH